MVVTDVPHDRLSQRARRARGRSSDAEDHQTGRGTRGAGRTARSANCALANLCARHGAALRGKKRRPRCQLALSENRPFSGFSAERLAG
jgi:hypothetical protein